MSRYGSAARLTGRADIGGGGTIVIGDAFSLVSKPVRSHVFAIAGATVAIGDNVQISYGAAITALRSIEIGSNSVFGPFLVIMDSDFHRVGNRYAAGEVAPVRIGSNVLAGARVTILRGSVIGDNVQVQSGSMVSGIIPSNVAIAGVPARVVVPPSEWDADTVDVPRLIQTVLGLAAPPSQDEGPEQIPAWDSLGTLRLLLAIEERYDIRLSDEEMRAGKSVADVSALVERKLGLPARNSADPAV